MLLTIHDASLRKVAFIDNDKQATLNYFNETWTRYLETGSSTFDFTVFKKAIAASKEINLFMMSAFRTRYYCSVITHISNSIIKQ